MITGDFKDVKDLVDDLDRIAHRSIPFATKQALNDTAWKARFFAQRTIRTKMVERNKWTAGSIRVDPARTLRISQQESAVGSTEVYMETQEFGDTEHAKRKHGVAIPTGYSAGQMGQRPRTRVPRRANRLANIRLSKVRKGGMSRKARIVATIRQAVRTGERYVFLDLGDSGRKGIFKVVGGRKKSRGRSTAKLRMVQDLSQRSVRIPKTPWLNPSVLLASLQMDDFYRRALLFQLRRLKTT
jgi:hypothetical protein